jgi:thioredoxin 1
MAITHLTKEDFDAVTSTGASLVDFWATWCGPCRMQAPILEQLDAELGDSVKVCKVDVDEQPALAQRFGIMSIPTLVAFKGGQIVNTRVGVQSLDALKDMLA